VESNELQAFVAFARAARLPLEGYIEEPRPPAPDILARVAGKPTAYEVTEAVEPEFAKKLSAIVRTPRLIREVYATLGQERRQAMEESHRGKVIGICFRDDVSLNRREQLLPGVFDFVQRVDALVGARNVDRIEDPLPEVHHISMSRFRANGIHWEADATAGWIDPEAALRERLIVKMTNKSYKSEHPMELIVYFWREVTPPLETGWIEAMQEVARARLANSPFRRVWLYDDWTKRASQLAEAANS
jgi:hypothetical protein